MIKKEKRFLLFGDNLWESKNIIELIRKHCNSFFDEIKLEGFPSLPIYKIKYGSWTIIIECRGNYNNWTDLPKSVKEYIKLLDKPDVVLYDSTANKTICAAEFTETVSVGNSQWQRSGRVVASTIKNIPFLTVYPAVSEDRSQGTLREPTALLTELFLKLSKEDPKHPTFLILRDDPYLKSLNKIRKANKMGTLQKPNGETLIAEWFTLKILSTINPKIISRLKEFEIGLYENMFKSFNQDIRRYGKISKKVDNDIPAWRSVLNDAKSFDDLKKHTLQDLSKTVWVAPSGKAANKSYFKKDFLKAVDSTLGKDIFKTYCKGGKHCVAEPKYVKQLERIIFKKYPPLGHNLYPNMLNKKYPLILVPIQGWQASGALSDPNCGEAAAFPALFEYLDNENTNIMYVIYGKPPKTWLQQYNKKSNKLFRAIGEFGNILCIDINEGGDGKPHSIQIK